MDKPTYSRCQPLWHVAALNVLTLYGYSLIWFYKNWKQLITFAREQQLSPISFLDRREKTLANLRKTHLWLNTLGLMLPYIQIYFATLFFMQVAELSPKRQLSALSTAVLLVIAMMMLLELHNLPGYYGMLFVLATCPLVFAQGLLNNYWQSVEPGALIVRQAFSAFELFLMIIGSITIGLTLTGITLGIN